MNEKGTGNDKEANSEEQEAGSQAGEKDSWLDDMLTSEGGTKSNTPVTDKLKRRSSGAKPLPGLRSRRKSSGEKPESPEEDAEKGNETEEAPTEPEEEKAGPPPLILEPETAAKKMVVPPLLPESETEAEAKEKEDAAAPSGSKEEKATKEEPPQEETVEKSGKDSEKEEGEEEKADSGDKEKTKEQKGEGKTEKPATSGSGEEDAFVSVGADSDPWFDGDDDPVILVDTPVPPEPEKKKGCGCWTVFATLFFLGTMLVLVLVGALAGIAYAKRNEVVSEFTQSVHDSLSAKGLYVDYGSFRYEFPRGIVVSDLVIFPTEAKEKPIFSLSDAGLNTDWVSLAKAKGKSLDQVSIDLSDTKVTLHDSESGDAVLEGVNGDIVISGDKVTVDRLITTIAGVDVELSGEFPLKSDAESGFSLPVSAGAVQELANWLEIESDAQRPRLMARLEEKADAAGSYVFSGLITGNQFTWRDLRFDAVAIPFLYDPSSDILRIEGLLAEIGGGTVSGKVFVDGPKEAIVLENLRSSANWISILGAFSPSAKEKLARLEMVDNPFVTLNGSIPLSGMIDSTLQIEYTHWQGLLIPHGDRKIPFSQISGEVKYSGRKFDLRDFHLAVFGGPTKIDGSVVIQDDGPAFDFMSDTTGMDLARVAKYSGIDDRLLRGSLDMVLRLAGNPSPTSWRGNGNLKISDARLNGLPAVGPSQVKVGEVVPVIGRQDDIQLTGSFIIESGVFLSSDIVSKSEYAMLRSGAQINLDTRDTEFSSGAYLEGELAETTGLKDKPIVVEGKGKLGEPEVKIKELPAELAKEEVQKALGMTASGVETIMEMLGVTPGEEGNPGESSEEAEEESNESDDSAQSQPEESPEVRLPTVAAPVILD